MLVEYYEVDETGKRVEVHVLEENAEIPPNYYKGWGEGFYNPKIDIATGLWVESATQEEIDAIHKPGKTVKTNEELQSDITELQNVINFLLLG